MLAPARSVYREQVEKIFPWELVGREKELADLAEFCTDERGDAYTWWQAPAWAGKSALMASFALDPPPGVRVVSFFVTARWAGQSDWVAFLDAVLEQLAEAAEQPVPHVLEQSAKQRWFGHLLKDAAAACAAQGVRLVLLVDGLDEDRGVTVGADAHSIAAMLPAVVPANVRIVVSGRPHPPVPVDVPQRHPLRDARTVRQLASSPHALLARDDLERELAHLLDDEGIGHDVLGFVTAAGGGLSEGDLAELTAVAPWKVRRVLRAAEGRTFAGRVGRGGLPLLVLAHEELQQTATASLGDRELSQFRERIHQWADRYRDMRWSESTPEYLLDGYHRLLYAQGDIARMAEFSTDRARQDRMLAFSGGDAAAFREIGSIHSFLLAQEAPDLAVMLHTAAAKDRLFWRNRRIPAQLPALWAALGDSDRADSLAGSLTPIASFGEAVAELVAVLSNGGDSTRADQLRRLFAAGIEDQDNPRVTARARACLVRMQADLKDPGGLEEATEQARTAAEEVGGIWAASTLVTLAQALLEAGQASRAEQITAEAEAACWAVQDNPVGQTNILMLVAKCSSALAHTARAEKLWRAVARPASGAVKPTVLEARLALMSDAGQVRGLAATQTMGKEEVGSACLRVIAERLVALHDHAAAEQIAATIPDWAQRAEAYSAVGWAALNEADLQRARRCALLATRSLHGQTDPDRRARNLVAYAEALALSGAHFLASDLAGQTERFLMLLDDPASKAWGLQRLARVWALMHNSVECQRISDTAIDLLPSIEHEHWRPRLLSALAETFAGLGIEIRADGLFTEVRRLVSGKDFQYRYLALADLAQSLSRTGQVEVAEETCRTIEPPLERSRLLAVVAAAHARAGAPEHARTLTAEAEDLARSAQSGTYWENQALASVAIARAALGELAEADRLAMSLHTLPDGGVALASVAEASEPQRATQLLAHALAHTYSFLLLLPFLARYAPEVTLQTVQLLVEDEQSDLVRTPQAGADGG
ncbi:hypothetical protein [Streptomyces sp. NPDC058475]|uniref:hypothetical protein n=1 Tax=Streptomyces sp. NPDC058475 TaxID=3346518 RepID=UPI003660B233